MGDTYLTTVFWKPMRISEGAYWTHGGHRVCIVQMDGCKTPTPRRLTAYGIHSWAGLPELLPFTEKENHFLLLPAYVLSQEDILGTRN